MSSVLSMPLLQGDALFPPVVSVADNFDRLCFPAAHASRRPRETYYVRRDAVLRTHMTAQERVAIGAGHRRFLLAGDVFRRDCVDATHMPVFHQLEGVCFVDDTAASVPPLPGGVPLTPEIAAATRCEQAVLADLVATLGRAAAALFGNGSETRWLPDVFPYTHPSLQLEVRVPGGPWTEVLGCGVLRPEVYGDIVPGGVRGAWAFGAGLERLAMAVHGVPDIRLFWSTDPRFVSQFAGADIARAPVRFVPFSSYPPIHRDVSVLAPAADSAAEPACALDVGEIVRSEAGDLVESVFVKDAWRPPGSDRCAWTFRVTYRAMDRTLTDAAVNAIHARVRSSIALLPGVLLR